LAAGTLGQAGLTAVHEGTRAPLDPQLFDHHDAARLHNITETLLANRLVVSADERPVNVHSTSRHLL
jgi:hypothetical protein